MSKLGTTLNKVEKDWDSLYAGMDMTDEEKSRRKDRFMSNTIISASSKSQIELLDEAEKMLTTMLLTVLLCGASMVLLFLTICILGILGY